MDRKHFLSDKELAEILENMSDSEDGLDFSDTDSVDDPNYMPSDNGMVDGTYADDDNQVSENEDEAVNEDAEKSESEDDPTDHTDQPKVNKLLNKGKPKPGTLQKRQVSWKHRGIQLNDQQLAFHGNTDLSPAVVALETPYSFFKYFFTDEFFDKIVEESNLYTIQKNPNNPANFTSTDIRQFMGICLYMTVVHMPNIRSYWSAELGYDLVRNVMPVNKFEKIRRLIHFNDNSKHLPRDNPDHDRLHKIRPLIDHLNEKFTSITLEPALSVDEQMCATKVRHYMKQYMPLKPHKWGFKLFILAGVSGFAYRFEIYSGQENLRPRPHNEPDLGASTNIVVRLSRIIPNSQNYRLYYDNYYYIGLELMVHLAKKGIYALGIRRNIIPGCKLPLEKDLKKEKRGTCDEYMATVDGIDVSSIIWKDNKYVTLLSTFAGKYPITSVKRYDKKEGRTLDVECPNIIQQYNKHMGVVDLMDSLLGRYRIRLRSRKWYLRIFYHLLDLTLVNAWLLYKRVMILKGKESQALPQSKFRSEVANCLCNVENKTSSKRGRPSNLEQQIQAKKHRGNAQHIPPKDVRTDQTGHWPSFREKRTKCKFPNCKGYTDVICEKCGVVLCFNKKNYCFKSFHE